MHIYLVVVALLAFACRVHADAHVGQDRYGNLIVNSSGLPGVGVYIDGEEGTAKASPRFCFFICFWAVFLIPAHRGYVRGSRGFLEDR